MRTNEINLFYQLLEEIEKKFPRRSLSELIKFKKNIPNQGVYFFFEQNETRQHSSDLRVVRVGTHAAQANSKATIKQRLAQHKGPENLFGSHRASVFRELVGYSLINKTNLSQKHWGIRKEKSNKDVLASEKELEKEVSLYLRDLSFTILEIEGEASKDNDRAYIERNTIALLSNYNRAAIDSPSPNWLGSFTNKNKIVNSGLWNSNYVDISNPEAEYFNKMRLYIDKMNNWC
jgi:hypothetical protein